MDLKLLQITKLEIMSMLEAKNLKTCNLMFSPAKIMNKDLLTTKKLIRLLLELMLIGLPKLELPKLLIRVTNKTLTKRSNSN